MSDWLTKISGIKKSSDGIYTISADPPGLPHHALYIYHCYYHASHVTLTLTEPCNKIMHDACMITYVHMTQFLASAITAGSYITGSQL